MNKKIIATFIIVLLISLVTTGYYLFFVKNNDLEKKLNKQTTIELNKDYIGVEKDSNGEIIKIKGIIEKYSDGKLTLKVNEEIVTVAVVNSTQIYFLERDYQNFSTKIVSIFEYYYDLPDYPKILEPGVLATVKCDNLREGEITRAIEITVPKEDLSQI